MPREFNLIGLGNSLVDILLELTEPEFGPLGFERGTMRLTERDEQQQLLKAFGDHEPRLVSGGSVANSVIACSQLGGKGSVHRLRRRRPVRPALLSPRFAELEHRLRQPAARRRDPPAPDVSIITPDAERTMRTCLAVSSHLDGAGTSPRRRIADGRVAVRRGVRVRQPPARSANAIREATQSPANKPVARGHSSPAPTRSSPRCSVPPFAEALAQGADLLFCQRNRGDEPSPARRAPDGAFAQLKTVVPNAVVTDGPQRGVS